MNFNLWLERRRMVRELQIYERQLPDVRAYCRNCGEMVESFIVGDFVEVWAEGGRPCWGQLLSIDQREEGVFAIVSLNPIDKMTVPIERVMRVRS